MTERYYQKEDFDGAFYIFDSETISEKDFEEKYDYDGYDVFADSLTGTEILKMLNENADLKIEVEDRFEEYRYLQKELYSAQKVIEQLKQSINKDYEEHKRVVNKYVDKLNEIEKKNEQLREALKNNYCMEICENCKHSHYWITENVFGSESNFRCEKGHTDDSAEITECVDFELDLKVILNE